MTGRPQNELIKKYDIPVPRYTSYPPVPFWTLPPSEETWIQSLRSSLKKSSASWSVYVHLPYCESLCHFCGCTKIITKDHGRANPYLQLIERELEIYLRQVPELKERPLAQVHFGGGSPTFFSEDELKSLAEVLTKSFQLSKDFEGSIEVDPRRLRRTQLEAVRQAGFNRVSLGVQDFDPVVQMSINRIQPYDLTAQAVQWARELGFRSINFDLIYGLPKQTLVGFRETIRRVIELRPERIALYSLALIPWLKPSQRLFKDEDLPSGGVKRELYENARAQFLSAGYIEIGMDHFALPSDELAIASREGRLHRNFMGYTDTHTEVLLGLGMSSISECPTAFHQNHKELAEYEKAIFTGHLATDKGHCLSEQEQRRQRQILDLMTNYRSPILDDPKACELQLSGFVADGLVRIDDGQIEILEAGKPFVRNICATLDDHMKSPSGDGPRFSKSI